jgi:hypothetical protein
MRDADDKTRGRNAWDAFEEAGRFFMGQSPQHRTMHRLCAILDDNAIPYAVAGAMALNIHGFNRVTTDVDILVTRDGLARLKSLTLGRGYLEKYAGSKGIRDTIENVSIDFLIAGDFPGDGREKPIAFPDPDVAERSSGVRVVPLAKLLELKLASGLSAPHRAHDLGDVQKSIVWLKLPRDFCATMHPSVHAKWDELWGYAQIQAAEDY